MRVMPMVAIMLLVAVPAGASPKMVNLFYDGARVEQELSAAKGYLEVPLPGGMQANSLRVVPVNGTIRRVEIVAGPKSAGKDPEQARLSERRDRLNARLTALEVREEIFKSAAKSQSGKAPRKTKANPEPLVNIRRGTEFALSQLEEVYRLRLGAERELREVEKRLAEAGNGKSAGGSVAKVWLQGNGGKVRVSYLVTDRSWRPHYDLRLVGGTVTASLSAILSPPAKGETVRVTAAPLDASAPAQPVPLEGGEGTVAVLTFPLEQEQYAIQPLSSVTFSFTNGSTTSLPPGEADCDRQGEFLGTFSFPGAKAGERREVTCGR